MALGHIAVIPDGNRRWARERGLTAQQGHLAGIAQMGPMAEAAWDAGAEVFTFWWGSPANLQKRDAEEVVGIVAALSDWLAGPGAALVAARDAAFEIHGRWPELAPAMADSVETIRAASGSGPRRLVVLMGYDGRDEIVAAADTLGGGGGGREAFGAALWTGNLPVVDLVVRTGAAKHLSAGFLLWSISEARLAFSDAMWPAYTVAELKESIAEASASGRRYGR